MNVNARDALVFTAELFESGRFAISWGAYARDRHGEPCDATRPRQARALCTLGALGRIAHQHHIADEDMIAAHAALRRFLGIENVFAWNDVDGRTPTHVAVACRGAASLLESEG